LPAAIDQRRDGATPEHVEPTALQRESIICKIAHRGSENELAAEPRLHRVLIRGGYVREMPGLQRAQVRIDHFCSLILVFVFEVGHHAPTDESNKQHGSSERKPAQGHPSQAEADRTGCRKIRANLTAERNRRGFVKLRPLERGAKSLLSFQDRQAFGADLQVPFELRSAGGVQFAVEIAVKNGACLLTAHGWPPQVRAA